MNCYKIILLIFFLSSNIYADNNLIYFKKVLSREDIIFEINFEKEKIITIPQIDSFPNRSNIVDRKVIYSKYDRYKLSYGFYLFDFNNGSKKFLFWSLNKEKIINISFSPKQNYIVFSTTNYNDKPNSIILYKYSFKLNKLEKIFEYNKKGTFINIESIEWLNDSEIIIKIYEENKEIQTIAKWVDVNTNKTLDIFVLKTDILKVFTHSSNGNFLAYHHNNGNDKSIDLALIHIYNFKDKKNWQLSTKKKKNIINQAFWGLDADNLYYLEASGSFNPEVKKIILTSTSTLKSISIKNSKIESVIASPEDSNIIEIWEENSKGFLCQINKKEKDENQLVLINRKGIIEKILIRERVVRIW